MACVENETAGPAAQISGLIDRTNKSNASQLKTVSCEWRDRESIIRSKAKMLLSLEHCLIKRFTYLTQGRDRETMRKDLSTEGEDQRKQA